MLVFCLVLSALLFGSGNALAASLAEAQALVDTKEFEKAAAMLEGLISSDPENAAYHQLLGDAYRNSGRLDEAIVKLKQTGAR